MLKLDTEGSELDILKGAQHSLSHIGYILIEVANTKRFEGGASLFEICQFLADRNFHPRTVEAVSVKEHHSYKEINHLDLLFVHESLH